ncbi:MAG: 30S ribosomal protein S12 methylthiotransferase RimO [Syntrophomonadaceae bacterium]|nr:30S ribosomal protein S12 methylthiotransferase RimO [Syntrophomonadaceae bacterium]
MNIGFISLGCAKNQVDTEIMMGLVKNSEHKVVNNIDKADLVVVNTCGFINEAKEEAIDTIIDMGRLKENGSLRYIIAAGCLAQRYGDELMSELPELDGITGIGTYHGILELIDKIVKGERPSQLSIPPETFIEKGERVLSTPPGSAYLKITEGCNNHCAYCAIPLIRGQLRSADQIDLVKEAKSLAKRGIKELVILGQDTAMYGKDLEVKCDLPNVLKDLSRVEGIEWIRLMYLHPAHINEQIIDIIAQENKIIPYLDIPVQHASAKVLKRMNRGHDLDYLNSLMHKLRTSIQGLVLRTTVMTGFPGESKDDFQILLDFVKDSKFDWLGCFAYSPEEDTPAALFENQIPDEIKEMRMNQILRIQKKITRQKNISRLEQIQKILITGQKSRNLYTGRGYFQAPDVDGITIVKTQKKLVKGEFAEVKLKGIRLYDMIGEIVE